ncbi:aldehyde dehydrogenase (NADP(+)) [Microbacterium sp. EYE_5]|uniref:aldehyde dehydrogenase (NADP(+)) n=1 Tax=unclassified Microbacterium TaxID=2609290 RepID=UPI0020031E7B|nr:MULTISPECIES: aldehyde dehydrogenase (NADP(+)) [unclassified Microbacterium]MCK6079316.1 aldehyde dehydrogenase (NADP(+)) [Microbacterium sp. EYE_382]MCK6084586.1 aldehyde dehydrogenase (NADP(+)) [Microbacterium sp. EYE_384]MCK6123185.1 aldehyde dehydrogenase (NADP(+)) [Microbacterium sp. EYE_80]MCK6125350.1 aldehyde dehydrogenase (NADP(+)) [Microbacterium sp. EYE_79]MCK6140270.1 aldehyde dehydrogenase (NADP(+)) [Microbacterium sp. EYE_39]
MITTTDPRTGREIDTALQPTSEEDVAVATRAAAAVAADLADHPRDWRADLLDRIADALDADRTGLVATADRETGLGDARLSGELTRSVVQFRMFADAVREGSYLEAIIDHAATTELGPAPDVRRMLVPLGPVAVFGSSNFPFAFSVAGGDTASALAAGCPVIVKAHSAHPLTSARSFDAISRAIADAGAPEGTFGIVYGQRAGAALVADPRITAVGFTGSLSGGMALQRIIDAREQPIPLFGELSSLNPLFITPGAAAARADAIAGDLFGSVTGSAGQLCTKPGVAFVPSGPAGDDLVDELARRVAESSSQVLLNRRIHDSFREIRDRVLAVPGARERARGSEHEADGFAVAPTLVETTAGDLSAELVEEAFGPLVVVVRYPDPDGLVQAASVVPKSLTATLHHEPDEIELARRLSADLAPWAGRLVFNGYPTGVRVAWAQQHGGPWPATNSQHTSVGMTAMRRFLRPLAWQNAAAELLPAELQDGPVGIPRRVDGVLTLPAVDSTP